MFVSKRWRRGAVVSSVPFNMKEVIEKPAQFLLQEFCMFFTRLAASYNRSSLVRGFWFSKILGNGWKICLYCNCAMLLYSVSFIVIDLREANNDMLFRKLNTWWRSSCPILQQRPVWVWMWVYLPATAPCYLTSYNLLSTEGLHFSQCAWLLWKTQRKF